MSRTVVSSTAILKKLYNNEAFGARYACSDADSRIWSMWRLREINYHDYCTLRGRLSSAQRFREGTKLQLWVDDFVARNALRAVNVWDLLTKPRD